MPPGRARPIIPGAPRGGGALKIFTSLLATPVRMKFPPLGAPIPAKVLPLNLTAGSILRTLWALTSPEMVRAKNYPAVEEHVPVEVDEHEESRGTRDRTTRRGRG